MSQEREQGRLYCIIDNAGDEDVLIFGSSKSIGGMAEDEEWISAPEADCMEVEA